MSINIEDYLQKIDAYFKDKSQKDIYMTYIMLFSLIFAFAYFLFWDTSEASFKEKNKQIAKINAKINADKLYLQVNPDNKIANLDLEIKKLQSDLEVLKENNAYIKSKIETISSLIYDERAWGEYLHSISTNAKKYAIKVLDFTNEYAKTEKDFGHILDIELKTTANYQNTIKFINSLEKSDLVVDIHKLQIKANERLDTDLSISVWGITY